jgi:penicillin V acylase-like amidase (Ntn superfamily)
MKKPTLFLSVFILFLFITPKSGLTCTTFCLDNNNQPVFGRNFDWVIGDGLVIVNKRGVSKTAMVSPEETGLSQPAGWTSKLGSITFNMVCRELPMGGMNEAGLVVETMRLSKSEFPEPDSRPYSSGLQWIQYQLDNFSTVEQVIESDSKIRIIPPPPEHAGLGSHYLVSDRTGNCASIEFLEGQLVHHTEETMPFKTLTNNTYAESVEYLNWFRGFGGILPIPRGPRSLARFVRAADMVSDFDPQTSGPAVDYAFDILENVAQRWIISTQWSIVYDIENRYIYFRTLVNKNIRYVDLNAFDFSCETPVKVLDINDDLSGDVANSFSDYTEQINRDLIKNSEPDFSDDELDYFSQYPDSTVCNEGFSAEADNETDVNQ